jgi:hypothetical protein
VPVAETPPPAAPVAETPPPVAEAPPEPAPVAEPAAPPEAAELPPTSDGKPVAAETRAPDNTKVKVTAEGECLVCGSPCPEVHEKFPEATEEPELAKQVDAATAIEDPHAKAEAIAEVVPELREAQTVIDAKADLESRIYDLEGTDAPKDLIEQLDSIDPAASDAAERLDALEERVARWEGEELGEAEPSLGEVSGESEAARRATMGEAAERLEANKVQGSAGETAVLDEIASGQPIAELNSTAQLRGSQVRVRTSAGVRIVDHLVELPTGEIVALEVKTGGAVRTQYQIECDLAMELQGGRIVGTGAPGMVGPHGPIRTVVLQR